MNRHRIFLLICTVAAAFIWFSSKNPVKEKPSPAPKNHPSKAWALEPAAPATRADNTEAFSRCYTNLWREFKVDACDDDCFAEYVADHDPDLAKLIREEWTDEAATGRRVYSQYGLLLQSLRSAKKDTVSGLPQISQLSHEDPGNGYPLLFTALVSQLEGRSEAAAQYLKAAAEAPRFESYTGSLKRRLLLATADEPRMHMKAIQLYSLMPIPDYKELENLIGVNDEAFAVVLLRLTSRAVEVGGKGFELNWNPLEHESSISVLKKILPNEAERIPGYREILERTESPFRGESHWTFDEEKCSKEEFVEELQKEKLFLQTLN